MSLGLHEIETEIRYLTTEKGGRKSAMSSGYRGQFYYGEVDYDGFQFFPDFPNDKMITLGITVRALVRFSQERWDEVHSKQIVIGMPFQIREGNRTVGHGTVLRI